MWMFSEKHNGFFGRSSDTFCIYKKCLRIFGLWPVDGVTPKTVIINLLFLVIEISTIVPHLVKLVALLGKCTVDNFEAVLTGFHILTPIERLIFRLCGRQMIRLIESTIDDWSTITDPTERKIMKRHDDFGTFLFLLTIMSAVGIPAVTDLTLLIFPSTTMDHRSSCAKSESLGWGIVNIGITISVTCFSYYSCVVLFWSLTMHLCGQFRILKLQFKDFLLIRKKKVRRTEFRRLVDRHNQLLDLSGKLEDSFNIFLGGDLITGHFMICLAASRLGNGIGISDFREMAVASIFIVTKAVVLFSFFYASDYLTSCAEAIGEVFTQCNWYDLSKESITDYSIVIARSRMPPSVTAVKLCKLSLSNFKYVLKFVYSYVSLIVAITKN